MAEQLTLNQLVLGSSPSRGTTLLKGFFAFLNRITHFLNVCVRECFAESGGLRRLVTWGGSIQGSIQNTTVLAAEVAVSLRGRIRHADQRGGVGSKGEGGVFPQIGQVEFTTENSV